MKVIIIGAGMGGLAAGIRLAQAGHAVTIVEAREDVGGLASGLEVDGFRFDAGPYILLDRPGLEWAFGELGMELEREMELRRVESIYEVRTADGKCIKFQKDLEATAAAFEAEWPGSGDKYKRFVAKMYRHYQRLTFMNTTATPGILGLLRGGAWREIPLLLRSLGQVLERSGLPGPIKTGIGIWTHVAGYPVTEAPSPMAFVPGMFHHVGAWYPQGGISQVPQALRRAAEAAGVQFRFGTKVRRILAENGRAVGVETTNGETLPATAVISNAGGPATYLDLSEAAPPATRAKIKGLPLQSPGFCIYLAVKGQRLPEYLRFQLAEQAPACVSLIQSGIADPQLEKEGWFPARLLGPLPHALAQELGKEGQHKLMDAVLAADWWKEGLSDFRVLKRRTSADWGRDFHLHRDSMNPVMTAKLMRKGRLAHKSPHLEGLYLAGSSTHPGQWVSFASISGIHAANAVLRDFSP